MSEVKSQSGEPVANALESRIKALDAVYRRFGREGLRDYPLSDIAILLASKELELRDAPKGREIGVPQRKANRLLELEIRELSGHIDALLSGAGLSVLQRVNSRAFRREQHPGDRSGKQGRGFEPER